MVKANERWRNTPIASGRPALQIIGAPQPHHLEWIRLLDEYVAVGSGERIDRDLCMGVTLGRPCRYDARPGRERCRRRHDAQ